MNTRLPEFVVFGDSITEWSFDEETEGFGRFLEKKYQGKACIVNEGKAGYTSTDVKSNFDRVMRRATSPNANKTLLFTILLGANDACIIRDTEYVPLPIFEDNIREFVETILTQDAMLDTKVVLITPPPININAPLPDDLSEEDLAQEIALDKKRRPYKTYMNKKRYAEKVMQLAEEYEETGRVAGLDLWNKMVDTALVDLGVAERDEEKLPGSGLQGGPEFPPEWFVDGLHLDKKGYRVLSNALFETVTTTWPDLAPEHL